MLCLSRLQTNASAFLFVCCALFALFRDIGTCLCDRSFEDMSMLSFLALFQPFEHVLWHYSKTMNVVVYHCFWTLGTLVLSLIHRVDVVVSHLFQTHEHVFVFVSYHFAIYVINHDINWRTHVTANDVYHLTRILNTLSYVRFHVVVPGRHVGGCMPKWTRPLTAFISHFISFVFRLFDDGSHYARYGWICRHNLHHHVDASCACIFHMCLAHF